MNYLTKFLLFTVKTAVSRAILTCRAAMVYRAAATRGLNVDHEKIREIGREISALQLGDGSFFFPLQPAYGRILTTLCAGTIMAIISDFSSEFILNLRKILPLLAEWGSNNGPTSSDFFSGRCSLGSLPPRSLKPT